MSDIDELSPLPINRKKPHRIGSSASAPQLAGSAGRPLSALRKAPRTGGRPLTAQVSIDELEDTSDQETWRSSRWSVPTPSCDGTLRSRTAAGSWSSSSPSGRLPDPGSGRFSAEEMACFRNKCTPSHGYRGKEEVYWQNQGLMKKSLSEGAKCWHTLPVLKGKFYCQDPLASSFDESPRDESPMSKADTGPTALPDEVLTAVVLDEIYPKTPKSEYKPKRYTFFNSGELSPGKDASPGGRRQGRIGRAASRGSMFRGSNLDAEVVAAAGRDNSRSSSSFFPASPQGGLGTRQVSNNSALSSSSTFEHSGKIECGSPTGADGKTTQNLLPLVGFRKLLEDKFPSVKEGVEFWVNEFPGTKTMTKKEFRRILTTRMQLDLDKDVRERIFNLLDLDVDGVVSLSEFQAAIDAAAPVTMLTDLRRRWLAAGFKSMKSALYAMSDSCHQHGDEDSVISSRGLSLREFGEALAHVHVLEVNEHMAIFNIIADPRDQPGRVSIEELASAISTVSPHLILEELRERLFARYSRPGEATGPLRRAWSAMELGGSEVRLQDFITQGVRRFGLVEQEAVKVFRTIDIDGVGYIDRAAFLGALTLSEPSLFLEDLRRRVRQRFRSLNNVFAKSFDYDGKVEQAVTRLTLQKVQELLLQIELTEAESETLFKLIDVESVGTLSVAEFIRGTFQFAPSCAFEDLRLQCLQRHQGVHNVLTDVDVELVASVKFGRYLLDFATFVDMLTGLRLTTGLRIQLLFDTLDVLCDGFISVRAFTALLQAGGPGSCPKFNDEGLSSRAKQDIRGYTGPMQRLTLELKAEARNGKHQIEKSSEDEQAAYRLGDPIEVHDKGDASWKMGRVTSVSPLKVKPDGWRHEHSWNVERGRGKEAPRPSTTANMRPMKTGRHQAYAPKLRKVPHDDVKQFVLQQSSLGAASLGPHSRAGDFRKLTENSISNPQRSFNAVWRNIQNCQGMDKHLKGSLENSVQDYYQDASMRLSDVVPLLEQPLSRQTLHHSVKAHLGVLEPARRVRGANETTGTQSSQSLPPM